MMLSRVRISEGSLNNGNIAQLVEQGAVNSQVVGSEPTIPAKISVTAHFQYFIWACMYQGWRFSFARREWRVRFPFCPQNFDVKVIPGLIQRYNLYIESRSGGANG